VFENYSNFSNQSFFKKLFAAFCHILHRVGNIRINAGKNTVNGMSSIGYLGRFFETASLVKHPNKKIIQKISKKYKSLIKNHKWIKSSSKKYNFYFLGALGQAVHQAVSKKWPKSPKLDIPFYI
jgi:hypothetical protein